MVCGLLVAGPEPHRGQGAGPQVLRGRRRRCVDRSHDGGRRADDLAGARAGAQQLTSLTGRTDFWTLVLDLPRTKFQEIFGFGLSNGSVNGLPIDSNWLVAYLEQGLFGVVICAAMLLFLLVTAFFQPSGTRRALAFFLITYCLVASFTQVGFATVSTYLLELTLAASLLVPSASGRSQSDSIESKNDNLGAEITCSSRSSLATTDGRGTASVPPGHGDSHVSPRLDRRHCRPAVQLERGADRPRGLRSGETARADCASGRSAGCSWPVRAGKHTHGGGQFSQIILLPRTHSSGTVRHP